MEEDDLEKEMKEILKTTTKEKEVSKIKLFNQSEAEINASIKLIMQRPSMLRILKYLMEHEISSVKEIYFGINVGDSPKITYQCVNNNLKKLTKAGILYYTKSNIDVRYSNFCINENFPVKRILERINPKDLLTKGYCNIWDNPTSSLFKKEEKTVEISTVKNQVLEIPLLD